MFIRTVAKTLTAGQNDLEWVAGSQTGYLIAAGLEEHDSSSNPAFTSGSVWISDQSGANLMPLLHGAMQNGQLSGFGCMPILAGGVVNGRLWHSRAGNEGKLNLYIITPEERRDLAMAINWNTRQLPASTISHGRPHVIETVGAATVLDVEIRPDNGFIWEVIWLEIKHDDPANRSLYFQIENTEDSSTVNLGASGAVASGVRWPFMYNPDQTCMVHTGKPVLTYRNFVHSRVDALAAGKKLTTLGLAMEYAE